jgi:hypothetical protein
LSATPQYAITSCEAWLLPNRVWSNQICHSVIEMADEEYHGAGGGQRH